MPISGALLSNQITMSNILQKGLGTKPDDIALVSMATTRTWRQLDEISQRLAVSYLDLGLKPGDRVASLMPNRASLSVHYIACLKAGLIATPLNYRYMAPEIDHALAISEARIMLSHVERADDLAQTQLVGQLPLGLVSFSDDDAGQLGSQKIDSGPSYKELIDPSVPLHDLPAPPSDQGAVIFFTSGSTGKPKGVTHSHETLGSIISSFIQSYDITSDDVFLPGSSFSHVGGYAMSMSALAAGCRVDVSRKLMGEEFLSLMRTNQPTILVMLPATLFALVRDHGAQPEDFASLRFCLAGGDKVSADLQSDFQRLAGMNIIEGFGMTECGFFMKLPFGPDAKVGSVGKVCAGYEISLRDNDGNEVPTGTAGRVWVKSPANMVGYWNNTEATAETIVDGWLDTGDLLARDEDGYFWFKGRTKQIIIHDGSNICPQEVEEAVMAHPAVALAGVVGVHDLLHGENVRAYVTLAKGAERPSGEALIAFAREQVGYKAPEEIIVLDEMPLNPSGKVDRLLLKNPAAKQH